MHCKVGRLSLLYQKAFSEFVQRDAAALVAVEGIVLEMLAEVARSPNHSAVEKYPKWLKRATELLHENVGQQ